MGCTRYFKCILSSFFSGIKVELMVGYDNMIDKSSSHPFGQKQLRIILLSLLLVVGVAYVYFALTPSHYSFFLKTHMGQQDYEPIMGQAYGIRSDEWGMVTSYFQIAANNDYQRFNQDSPYKEDLRFYFGLPLKDWALAFKPYMWGFFTLGDARGFSFYHFFMIASFIIGYTVFLIQLRLPVLYAAIIAVTLFFSHHNQVWWSNNAAVLALTIWIIIPFLSNWSLPVKFLSTFLISAAALLSLIYPPWQISIIYLVGIFALVFRPERFRIGNILTCFVGFALAAALCLYYLADIVPLMQNTVYPGDRSFNGGSSRTYYLWTLLFPHSLITPNYRPIMSSANMPEIGTVSSLFTLCLLVFGDYRTFFKTIKNNAIKVATLGAFAVLIFSWMYLPIPNDFGKFLLLDQIEPKRLLLTSGTFVIWLIAILAFYTPWKLSWARVSLYSILVLFGTFFYKQILGSPTAIDRFDVLALIPVAIIIGFKLFQAKTGRVKGVAHNAAQDTRVLDNQRLEPQKYLQNRWAYIFATVALIYNVVAFGGFNPVQSSHDIFLASQQPKVVALKEFVQESDLDALAIARHTAASASGLSLPTYNHVLLTPQLELFREEFPDLDDTTFNTIFNRYIHVAFDSNIDEPKLVQADYIKLPLNMLSESIPVVNNPLPEEVVAINVLSNMWQSGNLLNVKFLSPIAIKQSELTVLAGELLVSNAKVQTQLLFTDYFSGEVESPNDAILWELDLEFPKTNSTGVDYKDLDAVYIQVGDKPYKLLLNQGEVVTAYKTKPDKTYPIRGVIDVAKYDRQNATLTIVGWAPVDDLAGVKVNEQFLRWFGYDTDMDLSFQTLKSIPRPDVASIYGDAQRLSGYHLIFDVNTPLSAEEDIDFCLYSRTKKVGTYKVITDTTVLPSICSAQ